MQPKLRPKSELDVCAAQPRAPSREREKVDSRLAANRSGLVDNQIRPPVLHPRIEGRSWRSQLIAASIKPGHFRTAVGSVRAVPAISAHRKRAAVSHLCRDDGAALREAICVVSYLQPNLFSATTFQIDSRLR
jgi:hypothetical protein